MTGVGVYIRCDLQALFWMISMSSSIILVKTLNIDSQNVLKLKLKSHIVSYLFTVLHSNHSFHRIISLQK